MKYDFVIISSPRSGANMLATALNSHSDVFCKLGESVDYDKRPTKKIKKGMLVGAVCNVLLPMPDLDGVKKIIIKRPEKEIGDSIASGIKHYFEDVEIERATGSQREYEIARTANKKLKDYIDDGCLVIEYKDMVGGNKDTREIINGKLICNYLGIDESVLIPETYKPMALGASNG